MEQPSLQDNPIRTMSSLTPVFASSAAAATLTGLDWLAIASYFGILLGVAWWVVHKGKDTAADYFLAGRNLGWWVIGASIFASNIGSEHIVGLAGSGAKDGVAMAHYELHAWCLLVLAWVFVPVLCPVPGVHHARISGAALFRRIALCALHRFPHHLHRVEDRRRHFRGRRRVFSTLLPEMHFTIGGVDFDSFWIGSVLVIVLTGLYTMLGGMRAVAYNDAVQASF